MKKIYLLFVIMMVAVVSLFAQAPEKFSFQAVVRNGSNQLIINAQVGVRVSILQGSTTGDALYVETHTATTNANGLLTVEVGGGTVQQGTFANLNWADGPWFLKTETDPDGGNNYSVVSVQQLLSVPYALYAKEAGNGFSGEITDYLNATTMPAVMSALTQAGVATQSDIPTVPTNVSAFTNDAGYLTGYTETDPQFNAWDKSYNDLTDKPVLFSGDYNDLTNKPRQAGAFQRGLQRPDQQADHSDGTHECERFHQRCRIPDLLHRTTGVEHQQRHAVPHGRQFREAARRL